jgi:hypothetical protein
MGDSALEISEEKMELIEKIREYRESTEEKEILEHENEVLKQQNKELEQKLVELQSEIIDRTRLMDHIKEQKTEIAGLYQKIKAKSIDYDFLVTTPHSTSTVYGEIKENLENAKREVLVCSPWINYLLDEFKNFKGGKNLRIIVKFKEEDIETGITDLDKLRVLKDLGAEIRYNDDLHAKMIIIDSNTAIISSANLTKRGLSVNYEAGIIMRNRTDVREAVEFFEGVWKESKPLTEAMIYGSS